MECQFRLATPAGETKKPQSHYSCRLLFHASLSSSLFLWPVFSHFHLLPSARTKEACKVMQAWIICCNIVFVFLCADTYNICTETHTCKYSMPKCTLELIHASIQRQWKWNSIEQIKKSLFEMEMSFSRLLRWLFLLRQTIGFTMKWDKDEDSRPRRERRGVGRETWEYPHRKQARERLRDKEGNWLTPSLSLSMQCSLLWFINLSLAHRC